MLLELRKTRIDSMYRDIYLTNQSHSCALSIVYSCSIVHRRRVTRSFQRVPWEFQNILFIAFPSRCAERPDIYIYRTYSYL